MVDIPLTLFRSYSEHDTAVGTSVPANATVLACSGALPFQGYTKPALSSTVAATAVAVFSDSKSQTASSPSQPATLIESVSHGVSMSKSEGAPSKETGSAKIPMPAKPTGPGLLANALAEMGYGIGGFSRPVTGVSSAAMSAISSGAASDGKAQSFKAPSLIIWRPIPLTRRRSAYKDPDEQPAIVLKKSMGVGEPTVKPESGKIKAVVPIVAQASVCRAEGFRRSEGFNAPMIQTIADLSSPKDLVITD